MAANRGRSLTYPCARPQVERALSALSAATGCTARVFRALEPPSA